MKYTNTPPESARRLRELAEGLRTWQNAGNGFVVTEIWPEANPAKRGPGYEKMAREGMDEDQYLREHRLNFLVSAGVKPFPKFRLQTHVRQFAYNPQWPLYRTWDFGFKFPACLWVQVAPDERVWVLASLFGKDMKASNQSTQQFASLAIKFHRLQGWGHIDREYCDVQGTKINDQTSQTDVDVLKNNGIRNLTCKNLYRHDMYNAIRDFLDLDDDPEIKHPEPGMYVSEQNQVLIEGMAGAYKLKPGTDPTLPKDGYYEHLFDCLSIFLCNRFPVKPKFQRRYIGGPGRSARSVPRRDGSLVQITRDRSGRRVTHKVAEPNALYQEWRARRTREKQTRRRMGGYR